MRPSRKLPRRPSRRAVLGLFGFGGLGLVGLRCGTPWFLRARPILPVTDLELWWSGETGQGRIGAASGVALRSTGEDGRFIALRGIRDLEGSLRAGDILARSAVESVEAEDGAALASTELVDTRDWVRPALRGGRPVLRVRRDGQSWVPAERRSKQR